jgi:hypothetical protein
MSGLDWIFGSAPRRALLSIVLLGPAPAEGWTKADLELEELPGG